MTDALTHGVFGGQFHLFDTLPSTNRWAMEHITELRHGDVVLARRQTAGRGRFERTWASPANRGLTLSIMLHLDSTSEWMAGACGALAAMSVCSALEHFQVASLLKWPNDVLVDGRKIAGILSERDGASGALILGIGINVNLTPRDLAKIELLQPATSMRIEAGKLFDVIAVAGVLLKSFEETWIAARKKGYAFVRRTWQRHDCLLKQRVIVRDAAGVVEGFYGGMDRQGRLILRLTDGKTRTYWSGDVSVRTPVSG